MAEDHVVSQTSDLPATIAQLPFFVSGRFPKPMLLGRCEGEHIVPVSGRDFIERIRDIGLGLQTLGLERGDHVILLAESRPEWVLADLAVLASGAVTVPVYPTLSAEQVAFIVKDSGARIAIVSTNVQLEKLFEVAPTLPDLRTIVVSHPDAGTWPPTSAPSFLSLLTLDEVAARGHQRLRDGWGVGREFHDRAKQVTPDELATIIYTSGTTGVPKGVMLTHANLAANLAGVAEVLEVSDDDVALSFLPLCHGFERLASYWYLASGVSMVFAESLETVGRDLRTVRPTVMTGVPRVYEKLRARAAAKAAEAGGLKHAIFTWASRIAERRGRARVAGRRLSPFLAVQARMADRLVFSKIREATGGRLRFAVSGSAALGEVLGYWYYGMGIPIVEGYGLTETSPVLTVTPLDAIRFGMVGRPLPNVEIRIASDGEVLARGPNVMQGYYRRPDETAKVLQDGWFATGDIGELDADGYLKITDRKKELLVTSGGKKVAPQPIEAELRSHKLITEAVLVGDGRHFPAVLLVPDFATLGAELGVAVPAEGPERDAFLARDDVRARYQAAVDAVNARLAQFERIKRFHLLSRDLTLDAGELTPTMKVKRRVIESRYKAEIERMYGN